MIVALSIQSEVMDEISFCVLSRDSSAKELEHCLQIIRAQGVPVFEILIYHSGSIHGTRNLYNKKWQEDVPVNRIRNLLCKNAKYDFIALLDARIMISDDWYEQINVIKFFDLIGWRLQDLEGKRIPDWSYMVKVGMRQIVLQLDYAEWTARGFVNSAAVLGRKSIWEKVEFDETLTDGVETDANFCQKVVALGYRIGIAQKANGKSLDPTPKTDSLSASTYEEAEKVYATLRPSRLLWRRIISRVRKMLTG